MNRHPFSVALLALLLAACETPAPPVGEREVRYGRITRIDLVQIDSEAHFGLGSVIGGIAGGVIGNQIGHGTARDVATVAGVLGGGVVGAQVEKKTDKRPGEYIVVMVGNGVNVGITQPVDPRLKVGDGVRIDGTGNGARVVRDAP